MKKRAFTLIELLIVVAIIAILAAIAVPNFLEAQVRAKVARVKSDMRSVATALESYFVDNNAFPLCSLRTGSIQTQCSGGIHHVVSLSTPIAYLSSVSIADPFQPPGEPDDQGWVANGITFSIMYMNIQIGREQYGYNEYTPSQWLVTSNGPDLQKGPNPYGGSGSWWVAHYADYSRDPSRSRFSAWDYDPTNGTRSMGDINRWQSGQSN